MSTINHTAPANDGLLSDEEIEVVSGGNDETHAAGHAHGEAVREFIGDCVDTVKGWFS